MEFAAERQTFAAWLGTTTSTIIGPVSPQETVAIYRAKYASGTVGTLLAFLMSQPSLTGYSGMGTLSPNGSIIDCAAISGPGEAGGGQDASDPIAVLPPGALLTGATSAGSCLVVGVYVYRLGRSA